MTFSRLICRLRGHRWRTVRWVCEADGGCQSADERCQRCGLRLVRDRVGDPMVEAAA